MFYKNTSNLNSQIRLVCVFQLGVSDWERERESYGVPAAPARPRRCIREAAWEADLGEESRRKAAAWRAAKDEAIFAEVKSFVPIDGSIFP